MSKWFTTSLSLVMKFGSSVPTTNEGKIREIVLAMNFCKLNDKRVIYLFMTCIYLDSITRTSE